MFQPNQQIGNYFLVRKLGRGGFGEVWLAERRTKLLTTRVAVKLPLDEQIDIETIKQEAALWEQASGHPNVLPIIEADIHDDQVMIVSEFAPDGSLADLLKQNGKMSVEQAVDMTIRILDGLEFLHSRRIIHRDLKPANILLQGNTPRLADFGISRALRTTITSQSQNVSGTFAYMPPEAFDGKRNEQTDIWAVGVCLYQFLTGRLPYPQVETTTLIAAILMNEPAPLPDSVPLWVRKIVATALAKSPSSRHKSAAEMRGHLQRLTASAESLTKPIPPVNPLEPDVETKDRLDPETETNTGYNFSSLNSQPERKWQITVGVLSVFLVGGFGVFIYLSQYNNFYQSEAKNNNVAVDTQSSRVIPNSQQPNINTDPAPSPSPAATFTPKPSPSPLSPDQALSNLKKGMSYAAARRMLLNNGWKTVNGSANWAEFDREHYVVKKLGYTEMEACSGTGMGYCLFVFRSSDKKNLRITTYNNEEESRGGPKVSGWTVE